MFDVELFGDLMYFTCTTHMYMYCSSNQEEIADLLSYSVPLKVH